MEGERDRKEHGERENIFGETVRVYHCPTADQPLMSPSMSSTIALFARFQRDHSYNDDISLEDAIHTALLTLKEGFEGQMTEKTIEIGVVTVPSQAELEDGKVEGTDRFKPTFRKLTEEEIRDYLAL